MERSPSALSRRAVLAAAAAAGAAILPSAPAPALAQAAGPANIWSAEYTAKKGSVDLAMFRKRLGAPRPGERARPVLFLVHGSSISSRPSFDLSVPGQNEYSLMNVFANYGYDVWTIDHENYGRSARTANNSNIASGADDLEAGAKIVARETGLTRYHYFGESSGGLRAAVFAMRAPQIVDRLALAAFTFTGEGSPTLAKRAQDLEYYRTHNLRLRDRKMIESIFTRDKPGTSDDAVAGAIADAELRFGEQVPTGTYLDMTANLPVVDPLKIASPVLLLKGEFDGIAGMDDLLNFYSKLPGGDKQFVVLPGTAHSLIWAKNRQLFWHALRAFLSAPPYTAV